MELNKGKIKPTTEDEALVYSRLLRAQTESNYGDVSQAPEANKNTELSETDSYKLFCAMEKVLHQGYEFIKFDDKELDVVISSVQIMAKSRLDTITDSVENFSIESADDIATTDRSIVVEMASRALNDSGE